MAPTVLALAGRATARTYAAEIIGFWATTQKSRKSPAFQFDEFKVLSCGIVLHYNLNSYLFKKVVHSIRLVYGE